MAQRTEEIIGQTENEQENGIKVDAHVVEIKNGKVTPWIEDAYIPNKNNKFRPVYISLMLQLSDALSNEVTFEDIKLKRHFGTYFVTPVFSQPADYKYITDVLIPYLKSIAEKKNVDWKIVPETKKGMLGVVIPGRLAASLIQGMMTVKPAIPYLFNFLFIEEGRE